MAHVFWMNLLLGNIRFQFLLVILDKYFYFKLKKETKYVKNIVLVVINYQKKNMESYVCDCQQYANNGHQIPGSMVVK